MLNGWLNGVAPSNIWIGATTENQPTADGRIPELLKIPAKIRFISAEPMLEEINIEQFLGAGKIDWVICGGETGPNARPTNPDWVRSLRDQAEAANVPFFFKGAPKTSGRLLDKVEHNAFPKKMNFNFCSHNEKKNKKHNNG
jgi:protein gp37